MAAMMMFGNECMDYCASYLYLLTFFFLLLSVVSVSSISGFIATWCEKVGLDPVRDRRYVERI